MSLKWIDRLRTRRAQRRCRNCGVSGPNPPMPGDAAYRKMLICQVCLRVSWLPPADSALYCAEQGCRLPQRHAGWHGDQCGEWMTFPDAVQHREAAE